VLQHLVVVVVQDVAVTNRYLWKTSVFNMDVFCRTH